jgi:hypothetical protein
MLACVMLIMHLHARTAAGLLLVSCLRLLATFAEARANSMLALAALAAATQGLSWLQARCEQPLLTSACCMRALHVSFRAVSCSDRLGASWSISWQSSIRLSSPLTTAFGCLVGNAIHAGFSSSMHSSICVSRALLATTGSWVTCFVADVGLPSRACVY